MNPLSKIIQGDRSLLLVIRGILYKEISDWIQYVDGATLSVQASRTHYCSPRDNFGPYSHVEVGFPSIAPPDTWEPYADCDHQDFVDNPTDQVYAYVPIHLVREYCDLHGGLDHQSCPRRKITI